MEYDAVMQSGNRPAIPPPGVSDFPGRNAVIQRAQAVV